MFRRIQTTQGVIAMLVVMLGLLWLPVVSHGQALGENPAPTHIVRVDDSSTDLDGPGDATDWSNAYKFLQDGLDRALLLISPPTPDADTNIVEVRIGQGVYRPDEDSDNQSGTGSRSASFILRNRVRVVGAWAGVGANNPDAWDPFTYISTLSGDLSGDDDPDDPYNASLIDDNSLHVVRGRPEAAETNFSARLQGCRVTAGNADDPDAGLLSGGGIFAADHASPLIVACTFIANRAGSGGAADLGSFSAPQFQACSFLGNRAAGSGTSAGGGAIYAGFRSDVVAVNCVFSGNEATNARGGAIHVFDASVSPPVNSSGLSGSAILTNCTLSMNSAVGADCGGGVWNGGTLNAVNSIWWGNFRSDTTPDTPNQISAASLNTTTVCYSDVEGGWTEPGCDLSNIDDDPLFVDADGGDADAGTLDDDLRLTCATSPCVDTGSDDPPPPLMAVPLDTFDADRNGLTTELLPDDLLHRRLRGLHVDRGAIEALTQVQPCRADIYPQPAGNGQINVDDLLMVINGWGTCPASPAECPADIVGSTSPPLCLNGVVNVDDLLAVINCWGVCPCPASEEFDTQNYCWYVCEIALGPTDECVNACAGNPECIQECLLAMEACINDCMEAVGEEDPTEAIADCVNACGNDVVCIWNCVNNSDPADD